MMEKVGVQKQELLTELQSKYNQLKEKKNSLEKTAGADSSAVDAEMKQIRNKIESIQSEN